MNGYRISYKTMSEHEDLYPHINRMQRRIMAREAWVSRKEFEAESREEQVAYYKWMVRQCDDLSDVLLW